MSVTYERAVEGHCPACGGADLWLGSDRVLGCGNDQCPRPTAAAEILGDSEIHHVVRFDIDHFDVKHPLHERLDGCLLGCGISAAILNVFGLAGPSPGGHSPEPGSTYRVIVPHEGDGSGWVWERISGDDG